jgi:hypothetical protein
MKETLGKGRKDDHDWIDVVMAKALMLELSTAGDAKEASGARGKVAVPGERLTKSTSCKPAASVRSAMVRGEDLLPHLRSCRCQGRVRFLLNGRGLSQDSSPALASLSLLSLQSSAAERARLPFARRKPTLERAGAEVKRAATDGSRVTHVVSSHPAADEHPALRGLGASF